MSYTRNTICNVRLRDFYTMGQKSSWLKNYASACKKRIITRDATLPEQVCKNKQMRYKQSTPRHYTTGNQKIFVGFVFF